MRLLVLEDDRELGHALQEGLRLSGYAVNWVTHVRDAESALHAEEHDVLICASHIDKATTGSLIKKLRSSAATLPIIVIGERPSPEQRVAALDDGADDYLPQPFSIDELRAVIRAQLRRSAGRATAQIDCGPLVLDPAARSATLNGEALDLTAREFALLEKLAENAGRTVSKSRLEESLYAWNEEVESNAVEVHVHRLRKKLGPGFIRTVRGIGYVMDKPTAEQTRALTMLPAAHVAASIANTGDAQTLVDTLSRIYNRIESILDGQCAFTDDAARELRRPLSALRLQAELALHTSNESERVQALQDVVHLVEQASHLLEAIVALAHVDQRASNEVQSTVNLCQLCEQGLVDIADSAMQRDIEISLRTDCVGEVWGRPDMLALLIRNLAESVVFQARPRARVEVSVWQDDETVSLNVAERAGRRTVNAALATRAPNGVPRHRELTLALVKRIAHVHRAHVVVEHGPQGAHVAVTFPRAERAREFNWLI